MTVSPAANDGLPIGELVTDMEARAAYVFLSPATTGKHVVRTVQVEALVDLDEDGNAIGVELLSWPL